MASGNFTIGKGLSVEGFNKYILPELKNSGTNVTDFLSYSKKGEESILISLVGKFIPSSYLEETICKSLDKIYPILEKDSKENNGSILVWPHQIKQHPKGWLVDTIGVYQESDTASRVFQNLVIKYSAIDLVDRLEKTQREISNFGKRFNNF